MGHRCVYLNGIHRLKFGKMGVTGCCWTGTKAIGCMLSSSYLACHREATLLSLTRATYVKHMCASKDLNLSTGTNAATTVTRFLSMHHSVCTPNTCTSQIHSSNPHKHGGHWLQKGRFVHTYRKQISLATNPMPPKSVPDNWYCDVTEPDWARLIAQTLSPHISDWNSRIPLQECYPGLGLVTDALLEEGLRVASWEPRNKYIPELQKLQVNHPEKLVVVNQCFLRPTLAHDVYKTFGWDCEDVSTQLDTVEGGRILQVFGHLPHYRLRNFILYSSFAMATGGFPFHEGNAEFFFFLRDNNHKILSSAPRMNKHGRFTSAPLLMYLLYDVSTLLKIPGSATNRSQRLSAKDKDYGDMYLVKMTPKENLFENVCSRDRWQKFILFINYITLSQYQRLIPWAEHLAPGYGAQLLHMGYTMMDSVGDLSADHMPQLFKDLVTSHGLLESKLLSESSQRKRRSTHSENTEDL